jgi:UDP-N-acetylglucosamine 1-carboxyvinyltransferase
MAQFNINGGNPLNGDIFVAGNKNSALPIIAATVLTDEICRIENMPEIRDVHSMLALLKKLGKKVTQESNNTYTISGSVTTTKLDDTIARQLRASILYISPLLARAGEAVFPPPGGCVIGRRNMDSHFDVFESFGGKIEVEDSSYKASLNKPLPANIFLKEASVTATENAMLLAACIQEKTVIQNAAAEPHITDLALALEKMGVSIAGINSNHLEIIGAKTLKGFVHQIMPDHIEAGTFAIAAAATKGDLHIHNINQNHLYMTDYHLRQMGVDLRYPEADVMHVKPSVLTSKIKKIQVGLWPGFPTDLMSPMIVLASQAKGTTLCHDWMYESRMFFVDKLIIMGADITICDPHRVLVNGARPLHGQSLSSPDIRAGVALVIAALSANGKSSIDKVELIDRGYENITNRLTQVGADITKSV